MCFVINNSSFPIVKNNNTAYHEFGKYWMQARGLLNYRLIKILLAERPSTMLFSNVQSTGLPMDRMTWRFWTIRQSNGYSTSAPRSSAAKQWFEQLAQKNKRTEVPGTNRILGLIATKWPNRGTIQRLMASSMKLAPQKKHVRAIKTRKLVLLPKTYDCAYLNLNDNPILI